jgi:hypothetical protein
MKAVSKKSKLFITPCVESVNQQLMQCDDAQNFAVVGPKLNICESSPRGLSDPRQANCSRLPASILLFFAVANSSFGLALIPSCEGTKRAALCIGSPFFFSFYVNNYPLTGNTRSLVSRLFFRTALMRLPALILFVTLCASLCAGALFSNNNQAKPLDSTIQWALAQIESGHFKNPDMAKGSSGEVSRFQIMPGVWRAYSRSKNYSDPKVAWAVARKILEERQNSFVGSTGRQPTPFDLYVMWNKPGLYKRLDFNRKRLPHRIRDAAERFENLVLDSSAPKLTSK